MSKTGRLPAEKTRFAHTGHTATTEEKAPNETFAGDTTAAVNELNASRHRIFDGEGCDDRADVVDRRCTGVRRLPSKRSRITPPKPAAPLSAPTTVPQTSAAVPTASEHDVTQTEGGHQPLKRPNARPPPRRPEPETESTTVPVRPRECGDGIDPIAVAEYEDAMAHLSRMEPLYREVRTIMVDPTNQHILPNMVGMDAVEAMLWRVVVRPALARREYRLKVGIISPLHFAIIGPHGTGKRTAIRTVCATAGVDMVTITPTAYLEGDIGFAVDRAYRARPALVCFDGFEELIRRPDFEREFRIKVASFRELCERFTGVWLAFCTNDGNSVQMPFIQRLLGRRVAGVDRPTRRQAAELFFRSHLVRTGVTLARQLTDDEANRLEEAADGCTPAELQAFAADVAFSALTRCDLAEIVGDSDHVISVVWDLDGEPLYELEEGENTGLQHWRIPRFEHIV